MRYFMIRGYSANEHTFLAWVRTGIAVTAKRATLGSNFEALEFARSLGIYVLINLIADPEWDRERFRIVRAWGLELPEVVNISINTPYPGTESWISEGGRVVSRDYRLYDIQHAVLPTKLPLAEFTRNWLPPSRPSAASIWVG